MGSTEIGMILIPVPASVKARVWVGVVDPKPIVGVLPVPFNDHLWRFRTCGWVKATWIKKGPELLSLDLVWNVLDHRDLWHTIKDIPL
jgi:hypothetical protein